MSLGTVAAQDSVFVIGRVTNQTTTKAEFFSRVNLVQGRDTVASVLCDEEGYFNGGLLPAGDYLLSVTVRGVSYYQADLSLYGNADLNIVVNTDSIPIRTLRRVDITASTEHKLGSLLITSPHDPRLWDFHTRDGSRNASASVAEPTDLHPFYGDSVSISEYMNPKVLKLGWYQYGKHDIPFWLIHPDMVKPAPKKTIEASSEKQE